MEFLPNLCYLTIYAIVRALVSFIGVILDNVIISKRSIRFAIETLLRGVRCCEHYFFAPIFFVVFPIFFPG